MRFRRRVLLEFDVDVDEDVPPLEIAGAIRSTLVLIPRSCAEHVFLHRLEIGVTDYVAETQAVADAARAES